MDDKSRDQIQQDIAKLGKTYIPKIESTTDYTSCTIPYTGSCWDMIYKDKLYRFNLSFGRNEPKLVTFSEIDMKKFIYPQDIIEYTFTIIKSSNVVYKKDNILIFDGTSIENVNITTCEKLANYINTRYKNNYSATVSKSGVKIKKIK